MRLVLVLPSKYNIQKKQEVKTNTNNSLLCPVIPDADRSIQGTRSKNGFPNTHVQTSD